MRTFIATWVVGSLAAAVFTFPAEVQNAGSAAGLIGLLAAIVITTAHERAVKRDRPPN